MKMNDDKHSAEEQPITFEQLGLTEPILEALDAAGYINPTPIQAMAIPLLLEGLTILLDKLRLGRGKQQRSRYHCSLESISPSSTPNLS